jgi:hypothetical protein
MNDSDIRKSLTLTELGVIISLLISTSTGIFTLGVLYGDVQRTKADINEMKPKVDGVVGRVERIDANVALLLTMSRDKDTRR